MSEVFKMRMLRIVSWRWVNRLLFLCAIEEIIFVCKAEDSGSTQTNTFYSGGHKEFKFEKLKVSDILNAGLVFIFCLF